MSKMVNQTLDEQDGEATPDEIHRRAYRVCDSLSHHPAIVEGVEKWQEQTSHPHSLVTAASGGHSGASLSAAGSFTAELSSVRFAQVARQLNQVAKEDGLQTPAFRSPPRVAGVRRTIKRRRDGSATVSVALRGRPAVAVVADMIDGVLAANEPGSTRSADLADRLWLAATPFLAQEDERSSAPMVRRAA